MSHNEGYHDDSGDEDEDDNASRFNVERQMENLDAVSLASYGAHRGQSARNNHGGGPSRDWRGAAPSPSVAGGPSRGMASTESVRDDVSVYSDNAGFRRDYTVARPRQSGKSHTVELAQTGRNTKNELLNHGLITTARVTIQRDHNGEIDDRIIPWIAHMCVFLPSKLTTQLLLRTLRFAVSDPQQIFPKIPHSETTAGASGLGKSLRGMLARYTKSMENEGYAAFEYSSDTRIVPLRMRITGLTSTVSSEDVRLQFTGLSFDRGFGNGVLVLRPGNAEPVVIDFLDANQSTMSAYDIVHGIDNDTSAAIDTFHTGKTTSVRIGTPFFFWALYNMPQLANEYVGDGKNGTRPEAMEKISLAGSVIEKTMKMAKVLKYPSPYKVNRTGKTDDADQIFANFVLVSFFLASISNVAWVRDKNTYIFPTEFYNYARSRYEMHRSDTLAIHIDDIRVAATQAVPAKEKGIINATIEFDYIVPHVAFYVR